MLKPIVDSAIENAPSRYALVIGVAKRARQIVDKAQAEGDILVEKPVGIAVDQLLRHEYEIVEGPKVEEETYHPAPAAIPEPEESGLDDAASDTHTGDTGEE